MPRCIEIVLLRRIYVQEEIYQLLLTFSLVLIIDDLAKIIFGAEYKSIPKPHFLSGSFRLFGGHRPDLHRARALARHCGALPSGTSLQDQDGQGGPGHLLRPGDGGRLGINMSALFTLVFAFGAMLAGFGGALAGPVRTVFPGWDRSHHRIVLSCVVIGSRGTSGALIGSILIGTLETVGIIVFPEFQMSLIYLLMVVVLVVRPWGLFGRPFKVKALSEKNLSMEAQEISPVHFSSPLWLRLLPFIVLLVLPLFRALLPVPADADLYRRAGGDRLQPAAGDHGAALIRPGRVLRGRGVHGGLAADQDGVQHPAGVGPGAGGSARRRPGRRFFCVRLSGVHFAMLTLAFGQLVFTVVYKWYGLTGGDNGIQGIPVRAVSRGNSLEHQLHQEMYYFVLMVVGMSVDFLRRIRSSPFGATLKSIRENSQRAAYLGVNVKLYQWTAFVMAGAFTGLAGGLYALMEKSISPEMIHWTKSAEPVLMTIIGGIYSFAGPAVGAGHLHHPKLVPCGLDRKVGARARPGPPDAGADPPRRRGGLHQREGA